MGSLYSPESFRQRFAMETVETALRSQTRRGKVRCRNCPKGLSLLALQTYGIRRGVSIYAKIRNELSLRFGSP